MATSSFAGKSISSSRLSSGLRAGLSRKSVQVHAKVAARAKTANYVCVDCGYLYDGKKGAFEDLPGSYACPVCGAPKKRFKGYTGSKRSNDNKTMSARAVELREQLEARGEKVEEDNTTLLASGAAALLFLGAVYYFAVLAR
ncbi:hypothetical protein V8C86DRAFT_2478470 [Haematococcus lacustris]